MRTNSSLWHWLQKVLRKGSASQMVCVYKTQWQHRQIAGTSCQESGTAFSLKKTEWHHRETCGYGKKSDYRDNPQPSSNRFITKPHECSSETQCRWADARSVLHKIESVPSEMSVLKRIVSNYHCLIRESFKRYCKSIGCNACLLQLNTLIGCLAISHFL